MSNVEYDPWRLNPAAVEAVVQEEALATMRRVTHLAHAEVLARMVRHRRTGHLMRSTLAKVEAVRGMVVGMVGTNVFYAPYLEQGTGLYGPRNRWIVPRNGRFLRFPEPGNAGFTLAGRQRSGRGGRNARWVYARRVRGIRPLRMFYDASLVVAPKVEAEFALGAERITARLAALGA